MKQLIIILMSVMLGIYIYNMLIGDGEGTVKAATQELMMQNIQMQKTTP